MNAGIRFAGKEDRELRRELRRAKRRKRRLEKRRKKEAKLKATRKDIKALRKPKAKAKAPAPPRDPRQAQSWPDEAKQAQVPRQRRRAVWDDQAQQLQDEPPMDDGFMPPDEMPWEDEGEPPLEEESEAAGKFRERVKNAFKRGKKLKDGLPPGSLPQVPSDGEWSAPLDVGGLRVLAPKGSRGLVFPLAKGVYVFGAYPDRFIEENGIQGMGKATLDVARARLNGQLQSDRDKPSVGFLPLVLMAAKVMKPKPGAQSPAQLPGPAPATAQPSVGCEGCDGRCKQRR